MSLTQRTSPLPIMKEIIHPIYLNQNWRFVNTANNDWSVNYPDELHLIAGGDTTELALTGPVRPQDDSSLPFEKLSRRQSRIWLFIQIRTSIICAL